MKYDTYSDEELAKMEEENLIPAGTYDFEVLEAKDTFSNKGNDMTALTLNVVDNEGRDRKVFDYLVSVKAFAFKIKHFAESVGLQSEYQRGHMDADEMLGRTGKCKIVIQPAKGQYRAKNAVADYVRADGTPEIKAAVAAQTPLDDEIPF